MEKLSNRLVSWASLLDEKTVEQARTSSTMPFIYPHLALMPDAHLGLGATVGSVIPTLGAIIPAAVGVDIGCGMIAVQTQFAASDLPADRRRAAGADRARHPALGGRGTTARSSPPPSRGSPSSRRSPRRRDSTRRRTRATGASSSASLGSGNHFIEVSVDEADPVWLFLHSGSRGVGNKIAQHHIEVAQRLAKQWWIDLPDPDLAYLVEGTPEFTRYIAELRWAQHFALLNREEMMDRVVRQVSEWVGAPVEERERINCHHNFTEQRGALRQAGVGVAQGRHPGGCRPARPHPRLDGHRVVRRRGARQPDVAELVAARRRPRRSRGRRRGATFTHEQLREAMAGIEYRDTDAFIDEIPQAYKPIDQVMADAASLVSVRHTLRQLVNVKGD